MKYLSYSSRMALKIFILFSICLILKTTVPMLISVSRWTKSGILYRLDRTSPRLSSHKICSQQQRKDLLHKMCDNYAKLNRTIHKTAPLLIVDHAHKVAYCAVPKAGCSSWKTILANISSRGKVKPNMTLRELRGLHRNIDKYGLTKMQYNNKLSNYIKFMVVRHPMDRLLSAYRDKMRGRDVTYNHLANSVVKQFRQNKTNMEKFPTFLEFVRMVLSNVSLANEPHWSKYFYNCDPCQVKYDYVLKLETMQHDMDMLLSKVFQKEMQYVFVRKLNYFLASTKAEATFPHRLGQYEALSKKQVFDLSRKFEHERDFFGYRFNQDSLEADCCDIQDSAGKQSQSNCCC